jgi:hypothetical protein
LARATDDNSWLEDAVRVASVVPATSGQRWVVNVQLGVVVPVIVLACSRIAPGLRNEEMTSGRSSVLDRAAATLKSK